MPERISGVGETVGVVLAVVDGVTDVDGVLEGVMEGLTLVEGVVEGVREGDTDGEGVGHTTFAYTLLGSLSGSSDKERYMVPVGADTMRRGEARVVTEDASICHTSAFDAAYTTNDPTAPLFSQRPVTPVYTAPEVKLGWKASTQLPLLFW